MEQDRLMHEIFKHTYRSESSCLQIYKTNPGKNDAHSRLKFYFLNLNIVLLLKLSQFFSLCSPLPSLSPTPTVNHHTVVPIHGSVIYVLRLSPSPSFSQSPHHPPCLLQLSVCSMFLCFWFCFAH